MLVLTNNNFAAAIACSSTNQYNTPLNKHRKGHIRSRNFRWVPPNIEVPLNHFLIIPNA